MSNQIQNFISQLNSELSMIDCSDFDDNSKKEKQKTINQVCSVLSNFVSVAFETKQNIDWEPPKYVDQSNPDDPEWFDHRCDLYFQFPRHRNSHWVERGVFSGLVLKSTSDVLELCCGDGFNTYHFYSNRCNSVYAIDFDKSAHEHAIKNYSSPNISFHLGDIRTDIPDKKFDAVIWDTAIEHFTEEEIFSLMKRIKGSMNDGGILTGHTIKENDTGNKQLNHHEREFNSKEDLAQFFQDYFKNVCVFETIHPDRHNYYFYASDGDLPISDESENVFVVKK